MAFECQGNIEISILKTSREFVDNSCKEKVEADQFKLYHNQQVSTIECGTETKNSHKLRPEQVYNPLKGVITSYSSEPLSFDDVGSNCSRSITDLPPALISEILNCLDPKELGIVSCVSPFLHGIASDHHGWKEFYCERWGIPVVSGEKSWKELFVEREFRSRTFMGRYSMDNLYGHTEAVRTVFLLSSAKLIFTSGYDSVVRMWHMEEGLSISSSHPLGCTIRAVAADTKLLVAGSTDGFIHCWRAAQDLPYLFDLRGSQNQNTQSRVWEHQGPITSLALDLTRIYSSSWDMTVRIWDRNSLKCLRLLRHGDWVYGLAPRDSTIATTSGSRLYLWDTNTGNLLAVVHNAHLGNAYSLARSRTGNFLFTGGEDGAVHMFEVSADHGESNIMKVASWIPHTGPVYSLAFEFPWLVSASSDGKLSLINVRKLLKTSSRKLRSQIVSNTQISNVEPPQRMLHGFGCNLFSVDIGADRIICGGEEGVVRVWNFSQALEIEKKARAMRGIRLENRMRRRKLQIEMNSKGGRTNQCSVSAVKENPNGAWRNKRGVSIKLKV